MEMRRRIWPVAVSLFLPGIGHVAVGAHRRGLEIVLFLQALAWLVAGACAFDLPWLAAALLLLALLLRVAICVHARRLDGSLSRPRPWIIMVAGVALIIVSELASTLRHQLLAEAYEVPGKSMGPTLLDGDHVFVTKLDVIPERGQLVVYPIPRRDGALGGSHIKRVVGLAGDTVAVTADGLFVNGSPTRVDGPLEPCDADLGDCTLIHERLASDMTYIAAVSTSPLSLGEWSVPDGEVFVLGDNRDESLDSRHIGGVPLADIIGKPTFIWWSSSPDGPRWSRTLRSIR